jgi:hypothetical protein
MNTGLDQSDHFSLPSEVPLASSGRKALFFLLLSLFVSFLSVLFYSSMGIQIMGGILFIVALLTTGFSASYQLFPSWKYVFIPFWMFLGGFFWGVSIPVFFGFFLIGFSFLLLYSSFQSELKSQILLSFYRTANVTLSTTLLLILVAVSFLGAWFFSPDDILSYFTKNIQSQILTMPSGETEESAGLSLFDQTTLKLCRGDEECLASIKERLSFDPKDSFALDIQNPLEDQLTIRQYFPDSFDIVFTSQIIGKAVLFFGFFFVGMPIKAILLPIISGLFFVFGFFFSFFGIFKKSERMTMQEYFV